MHLVVIGLNHHTAPIELREKLSISEARISEALAALKALGVAECLILSTCNRTEVYACTSTRSDDAAIIECIGEVCGVRPEVFIPHLYSHAGHKAVLHLFRVASGIDSMVIGEAQILGQVKDAYAAAGGLGYTGPVLNSVFRQAIVVGKRARTETDIGRGAFSVGSAAVQLARSIFEDLKGRTVLMVGAGKMSELAITHLVSCGTSTLLVANRTHERASSLVSRFGGQAIPFDDLPSALGSADIVIASTGAERPVITGDLVLSAMRVRRGRPMFFIDIAVPRDVAPEVESIDNVFVYNIDDLQAAVDADAGNRQAEVAKIEAMIGQELEQCMRWFRTLDAVPVVTALRDKFEEIRSTEMDKLSRKMPELTPEQLEAIDAATRSIVNRICHNPMIRIKEFAAGSDSSDKIETICDVFGITPDGDTEEKREGG